MDHYLKYKIVYFVPFFYIVSIVICKIACETFKYKLEFGGKTCSLGDHVFTASVPKKIMCVDMCLRIHSCTGFAYNPEDFICTGCSGIYYTPHNLVNQPGFFFYTAVCGTPTVSSAHVVLDTFKVKYLYGEQVTYTCAPPTFPLHTAAITCQADGTWSTPECVYVDCGTPTVSSAHVVLGTLDGHTLYGAQVTYTCTPCTFYPHTAAAVIMCQSDGTWTTPECVYGPDVGRLSNGELIPTGAVGCALNFGSTCPGGEAKITGHRLRYNGQYGDCYCDRRCCRKNDCCFDSTCNEGH